MPPSAGLIVAQVANAVFQGIAADECCFAAAAAAAVSSTGPRQLTAKPPCVQPAASAALPVTESHSRIQPTVEAVLRQDQRHICEQHPCRQRVVAHRPASKRHKTNQAVTADAMGMPDDACIRHMGPYSSGVTGDMLFVGCDA
jgi:hypothetical protein